MLSDGEQAEVDSHLAACPLCRQKSDDLVELRSALKGLSSFAAPSDLVPSVRSTVRTEIYRSRHSHFAFLSEGFREFLTMRVMPYAVGSAASVVIGIALLWLLLAGAPPTEIASTSETTMPVFLPPAPTVSGDGDVQITPSVLAAERIAVSGESPSVNPQGALVALARSLTRGSMKDDEVVVVADVFGNGLANIEEVVEPLDDVRTVFELEKALRQDSGDAPFVPAFLDKRADSVRVVLKIQRVDVKTGRR
jgi:hypothetical protein